MKHSINSLTKLESQGSMKQPIKTNTKSESQESEEKFTPSRLSASTTNYESFCNIEGNRNISQGHVAKLIKSIEINGNISAIICREVVRGGKQYFEIIDGQHRFEALKILNLPIEFDCWKVKNRGMVALNENSKNWTLDDYLNFGIKDGIVDYMTLNKWRDETGLALTSLIEICSDLDRNNGGTNRAYRYKNDIFKGLSWRIRDQEGCEKLLDMITDFYKKFSISLYSHIRFVQAFTLVAKHPSYKHERMMKNMESAGNLMRRQFSRVDYIKNFEEIYNYGLKGTSSEVIFFRNSDEI